MRGEETRGKDGGKQADERVDVVEMVLAGVRTTTQRVGGKRTVRARATPTGPENQRNRRRGRPAWTRNPDDSPMRDGNRDRLIGLLTERAVKTLLVYTMELTPQVHNWLLRFYRANKIPKEGNWEEVSGEAFLRKLLNSQVESVAGVPGREAMYDCSLSSSLAVDPRQIATRIMEIRAHLAKEFIQDLEDITNENNYLLSETLRQSLQSSLEGSFSEDFLEPPGREDEFGME